MIVTVGAVVTVVLMASGSDDPRDGNPPAGSSTSGSPKPSFSIPTQLPSKLPSDLPTSLPSGFPTELPSGFPSGLESLIPSLEGGLP
ncbi:hypothetical protein ACIBU0_28810 [Streptomyces sp. NPDC049627]|uniref:hypothetical protein n=1 Tax=Streptomyces sp. NPDC049627 TaxID=3365595 RepID=UPI0037A7A58D